MNSDSQFTQCLDAFLALLKYSRLDLESCHIKFVLEMCDGTLRARVIPYDSAAEWRSGLAMPGDGGFALVRDT